MASKTTIATIRIVILGKTTNDNQPQPTTWCFGEKMLVNPNHCAPPPTVPARPQQQQQLRHLHVAFKQVLCGFNLGASQVTSRNPGVKSPNVWVLLVAYCWLLLVIAEYCWLFLLRVIVCSCWFVGCHMLFYPIMDPYCRWCYSWLVF